jgi:hypothetical protein
MQQRPDLVQELEDRFVATSRLSHAQAMALFEAMWEEARQLGVLPGDPWDGLEVDLRLARILSTCSPDS